MDAEQGPPIFLLLRPQQSPTAASSHRAELPGDDQRLCGWPWLGRSRFKLRIPEGAYSGSAYHLQSASGYMVLITLVSGVMGQPMGRVAPGRVRYTDRASETRGPCPLCASSLFWSSVPSPPHMLQCDSPGRLGKASSHAPSRVPKFAST